MDPNDTDVHQRALDDPAFLERFAAAYVGEWKPLDALAWRTRPGEPLPSGALSPGIRLAELQRAVYSSRTADAAGTAADELRELTRLLERERHEIDRAITVAAEPLESWLAEPAVGDEEQPVARARHTRGMTIAIAAVGVVAGLIVGVGGTQVASIADAATQAEPTATPKPTRSTLQRTQADAVAAELDLHFGRAQIAEDVPTVPMDARFETDSFRRLSGADNPLGAYYLARSAQKMCLIVVPSDGRYAASCVAEPDLSYVGIEVTTRMPIELLSSGTVEDSFIEVRWSPNGIEAGGRPVFPTPVTP